MLKPDFLLEMLEKQKPLSEYGSDGGISNLLYGDTAPYVSEKEVQKEIERNKDHIGTTLSDRNK